MTTPFVAEKRKEMLFLAIRLILHIRHINRKCSGVDTNLHIIIK